MTTIILFILFSIFIIEASLKIYKIAKNTRNGHNIYGSKKHSHEHIGIVGTLLLVGIGLFIYSLTLDDTFKVVSIGYTLLSILIIIPHLRLERKNHKNYYH